VALFINTNLASINAQRQLSQSTLHLSRSMEKLSSGLRINKASDDVAGLGVAELLRSQSRSFAVAARNANDGISMIGMAEGSMQVIADNLIRMRELAEQSATGTLSNTQRSSLQTEFLALQNEIDRIAETTEFNSFKIISATGTVTFQVGVNSSSNDIITLNRVNAHSSALTVATTQVAVSTQAAAQAALTNLDQAISSLAISRGEFGALENRLQATVANIQNTIESLSAAESRIRDVDIAAETANFLRLQIIQQAGVAILAQANQQPALALTLLGGQ